MFPSFNYLHEEQMTFLRISSISRISKEPYTSQITSDQSWNIYKKAKRGSSEASLTSRAVAP